MSEIKIETISQVHIGNGVFLQEGNDFIVEDNNIDILSLDKLGSVIGTDETIIRQWLDAINNGESGTFIMNRVKDTPYTEYTKRRISCSLDITQQSTLKEQIHDGLGRPYIPGSSIKGAFRTAVMSTFANEDIEKRLNKEDLQNWKKVIFGMENELLHFDTGERKKNSPCADIFRYLSIGDTYFDKGVENVVRQVNLNITGQKTLLDNKKQQLVETIRKGVCSQCRLKIADDFYQKTGICDLQDFFELINNHTYQLICDEIEFWDKGEGADYIGQDSYLDQLDGILDVIDACKANECVLRIGHASGWRFITGAWLEKIDKVYFRKEIVPMCRRNNKIYEQYPFPKSRRIDNVSNVFGFVKLISE